MKKKSKKRVRYLPLIDSVQKAYPQISRKQLISYIYCREVKVGNEHPADPKLKVAENLSIELEPALYVSRGAEKLAHALYEWNISTAGKVCIDAGASTGGFTDCLLQEGAKYVYAVDVGYNQLAYSLRTDERVGVYEKTNIMDFEGGELQADFAAADLSFRSIRGAAAHLLSLTRERMCIALIKPQYELADLLRSGAVDAGDAAFDGVVRDEQLQKEVLNKLEQLLLDEGVAVSRILPSPIRGRKGNQEYLAMLVPVS